MKQQLKRLLTPRRRMRTVEAKIDELLQHPVSEDYVFVKLLDENPVLQPMEKYALYIQMQCMLKDPFKDESSQSQMKQLFQDIKRMIYHY